MAWYGRHLGLKQMIMGPLLVKDENGKDCSTQWSPFAADTSYFAKRKQFMQNFRVNDLENLLKNYLMRV
jgi:hypothetical protein